MNVCYEKLDKLRAEVERIKRKIAEEKVRLQAAEQRLQEAENSQILADVGAMKLTPEQLAEFLQRMKNGKNPVTYSGNTDRSGQTDETVKESEEE